MNAKNPAHSEKPTLGPSSWLLQSPPGLANVLKKEMVFVGALERKQPVFIKRQRNHDLVFANRLKSDLGLDRLRVAETILRCPVFGRFKISKTQLQRMADELKLVGPRRLVVSVAGRHFQRQDLGRFLERELRDRGYELDNDTEDEVWMFCIDEAYYFGIPLKKARDTEGRSLRALERKGSLPPPVAAALAFAAGAKNSDVILDPVCGSGTLLAELHAYAPEARLFGMDIDREAIEIARENLKGLKQVELRQGDSRKIDLGENQPTLVVANLPFGVQFGQKENNPALYREILTRTLEIRDPAGWRAILLTSDTQSLRDAVSALPELLLEELFKVKIRGELGSVFRAALRKK